MNTSSQSGKGFSSNPKNQASKPLRPKKAADLKAKEEQAIALINQGKPNEAELLYSGLVAAGSESHIVHGNLGALLKIKGDIKNAILCFNNALKLNPNYPDAHNNLGTALQEQGDLTAAIASYNSALQLKPNYPEAHYNLGIALQEQGDLTAAITSYNTALQLNPDDPIAHNNLGTALQEQGDLTAAIASYNTAVQLKPNYPEAHYNLGNTLKDKDHLAAAIASYNTALQLKPNNPDVHNNLGNALQQKGDLDDAIASYRTALQLKPNHPDAHNNLGAALQERGDLDDAIASFKTALQLNPNHPETHYNLGAALKNKGDLDEALINHKRALELDPKYSNAFYGIGIIQAVKGHLKDSRTSFHKSIELNRSNTAALYELSKNIESNEDSKELAKQLDEVTRAGLDRRQEAMLEFATANVHHNSKNYAYSTQHLAKANKLKLTFYPSDLDNHLLQARKMMTIARKISAGNPSDGEGKIFIVGAPRCGSTLLESVLSTNPTVRDLGESKALIQAFTQTMNEISTNEISSSLSDSYAEKTKGTFARHTHSVDKNLYNFCLTEAIARAMPSARIIHCRRNQLDNILSMLRSNLKAGNNYTSDPLDAAKFLIHQEEAMRRFKRIYGNHIFTFDYDGFTKNPAQTLRPLINWLGLQWNERYLHPESSNRLINTASVIQARQPINCNSVGGWKNYKELLKPAGEALAKSGIFDP